MKTEDLVDFLARQEPALAAAPASRRSGARLGVALALALLPALAIVLLVLRVNPALGAYLGEPRFWMRASYCAAFAILGLAQAWPRFFPGRKPGHHDAWALVPWLFMLVLAGLALSRAAPSDRTALLLGHTAAVCPELIVLVSLPFFLALAWVARGLAPTRLRQTGAACGLAAGGLGALVYTLHCPELAIPFLAAWYALGVGLCVLLGALSGPALLRWR